MSKSLHANTFIPVQRNLFIIVFQKPHTTMESGIETEIWKFLFKKVVCVCVLSPAQHQPHCAI